MPCSSLRLLAIFVLALLAAPVAHDFAVTIEGEQPIISSGRSLHVMRAALPIVVTPPVIPATWTRITTAERNVITFGALRVDTDAGLQPFLATFLI